MGGCAKLFWVGPKLSCAGPKCPKSVCSGPIFGSGPGFGGSGANCDRVGGSHGFVGGAPFIGASNFINKNAK